MSELNTIVSGVLCQAGEWDGLPKKTLRNMGIGLCKFETCPLILPVGPENSIEQVLLVLLQCIELLQVVHVSEARQRSPQVLWRHKEQQVLIYQNRECCNNLVVQAVIYG